MVSCGVNETGGGGVVGWAWRLPPDSPSHERPTYNSRSPPDPLNLVTFPQPTPEIGAQLHKHWSILPKGNELTPIRQLVGAILWPSKYWQDLTWFKEIKNPWNEQKFIIPNASSIMYWPLWVHFCIPMFYFLLHNFKLKAKQNTFKIELLYCVWNVWTLLDLKFSVFNNYCLGGWMYKHGRAPAMRQICR